MSKYEKFCIYKIYHKTFDDNIYIGSTTNFTARKSQHKKNTYNKRSKKYNYPLYQYIRGLGGFDNFNIEIIEKYPCETKKKGLEREKELISLYRASLNTNKPIKDNNKEENKGT